MYIDTTGIAPGFNGNVPITANGALSTDNGASSASINFSGNQIVTNSKTGAVTNVDSTNIQSTGSDNSNYAGTSDVFQTLIALRDDLNNTQGLSSSQQAAAISGELTDLKRVQNGILQAAGEQGSDFAKPDRDSKQHQQRSAQSSVRDKQSPGSGRESSRNRPPGAAESVTANARVGEQYVQSKPIAIPAIGPTPWSLLKE